MKNRLVSLSHIALIIALVTINLQAITGQGYKIKLTIKGMPNKTILLGHYFAKDNFVVDDSIKLNAKGIGIFKGDKELPGGMYSFASPPNRLFDFMVDKQQDFSIEADTSDFYMTKKTTGNIDDELFVEYQKFLANKRKEALELQDNLRDTKDEATKKDIKDKLSKLNVEVIDHQNKLIEEHPNTFFTTFIKATMRVEVPDPPKDENGNIIDSAFQYNYYRAHYFDNFDIGDPRLVRTPLFEEKFQTYFEKVLLQIPDTLIPEMDKAIEKARASDELFRYVLVKLFNDYAQSQIMGMDAIYVHLAEKYYIKEATWSDTTFIKDLKERVAKAKPNLIGQISVNPQLVKISAEHFKAAASDPELKKNPYVGTFFNVHDIPAKYLAIVFWSADCGHCKKSVPALYEVYKRKKDIGLEVLAIHMTGGEEGKIEWIDFINKNQLYDWVNAWNPYDFSFKADFDVATTNVIYLLDKDKRIIAKRIGPEQVEEIIEFEEKKNK
ncbi:MAG: DUF5106 domain-containing protein [Bacteroidales bacterium]|nr:DUF5106 domain-containing protein [Bacteroidales bacterium]